ncbi:MAG: hypothetical protein HY554_14165 [Elusimicrobia bacterium]|nr:hypothetical protein [Elusimicrobiota bacterium]
MKRMLLALWLFAPAAAAQETSQEDRLKTLEQRLARLEGAPAKTSLSAFNPAIGMALDSLYRQSDTRGNFQFRTGEINIEAPIDPFLKAWAVLNGNPEGVEVEEAAMQTTALPFNLAVTGGRLFASFGRIAHWHDDSLPTPDRPRSLDTFIGGETQADGVEVSYLFPTPLYLTATAGAYNKVGGENARADNAVERTLDEFTYLGRVAAYADLGADHSLELGASSAWTPKRALEEDITVTGNPAPETTRRNTWRTLHGADLTYRYHPAAGGLYRGLLWSTEVLQNNERRFAPDTRLPSDRVRAFAGFSYFWLKLGRHWRPGALVDLTEDLDDGKRIARTWTAFLTCDVTEFNRLRLAYSWVRDNDPLTRNNNILTFQWTAFMGHHVHGFRDR